MSLCGICKFVLHGLSEDIWCSLGVMLTLVVVVGGWRVGLIVFEWAQMRLDVHPA